MSLVIDSAIGLISGQLGVFANQDDFWSLFDVAFGKDYNQAVALRLRSQWQSGDFSSFPLVEVISTVLGSANGAYGSSTNRIYLSDAYVKSATTEALIGTLLEEYGHFVDAQVNLVDSSGDEGAIFATLVRGESLGGDVLLALRGEDDHAVIAIDGEVIQVEHQNFTGTSGNDTITGTSDNDVIDGFDGNDLIYGLAGNDIIRGDRGNDTIYGGDGDDSIDGSYGDDTIYGGAGNDSISDSFSGDGGVGNDTIYGGDGDDLIYGYGNRTTGTLTVDGGDGIDTVRDHFYSYTSDIILDTTGTTLILPPRTSYTNVEAFEIGTGSGNDIIRLKGNYTDNIGTGDGNDIIDAGVGLGDSVSGGAGTDTLIVDYSSFIYGRISSDMRSNNGTEFYGMFYMLDGNIWESSDIHFDGIERFQITGTSQNDSIITGSGNDTIDAGAGNDTIDAGAGNDTIDAGAGNDIITRGDQFSIRIGEIDILSGGAGSDHFVLGKPDGYSGGNVFYDDDNALTNGSDDYADITDFDIGDTIQLYGTSIDYLLVVVVTDTHILINKPNPEPDELIAIVRNQTGLSLTNGASSTVLVTLPSIISLAVTPSSVLENGTANLVYTFTRTGDITTALTVNFNVGGTATPSAFSADYIQTGATTFTASSGTINFAANATTATIIIDPTADTTVEPDENVSLTLTSGTGYTIATTTAVTGTILNDDVPPLPSVFLFLSPISVAEDGTRNLIYTFARSGNITNALTVNFNVLSTAIPDVDFTSTGFATTNINTSTGAGTGTITFAAGASTAIVTIDPIADTTVEPNESIAITLASGTGYTIGTTTAVTGTIANDDVSVNKGSSVVITNSLGINTTNVQSIYTLQSLPVNGALRLNGVNLAVNGTFSQDDINNNRVTYIHNGSATISDSFNFIFADGSNTTTRISTSADASQSNGRSISADGRYVAFNSTASNLVSGDTNGTSDIFVKDLTTNNITRVSTAADGSQANSGSYNQVISANGRYVAFVSNASNLVNGDTNAAGDIFVKDLTTNSITRVSTAADGSQVNSSSGYYAISISANGRYVAFSSDASNLVSGDTNSANDIFVKDLTNNSITRISTAVDGSQANSYSGNPTISADGRYVAFASNASNLVSGDTNNDSDIFVKDLTTNSIIRVSTAADGSQGNNASGYFSPSTISANGRYVAFEADASNLVSGDTNNTRDIFVKDLTTNSITRISTAADGTQANNASYAPSISGDGRFVSFESDATNLVSGDTNGTRDVFVKDLSTNSITRLSTAVNGLQGIGYSISSSISDDGRYVTFAYNNNNGTRDVLLSSPRLVNGTTNIIINSVNNAPIITPTIANLSYTENAATAIDPNITITDADSTNLTSATISITTGFTTGQDILNFTNQNGITSTYNNSTGVLSLTGSSTVANYQTALRSITYTNNSDSPNTTARTIGFSVNDGTDNSIQRTRNVTITAVNDAPIVSNAILDQNAIQGTAFNFVIPPNSFSDPDASDILTYSATRSDNTALPTWLTFNPTTRTFSGSPTSGDIGALNVKVTATDTANAAVNDIFAINVTTKPTWNLDIDGDGKVGALSDGIIAVRYLFGSAFSGNALINGAISPTATRNLSQIQAYLQEGVTNKYLDIDGNGSVGALSDGIIAVRYLFGSAFSGNALIAGAIAPDATRNLAGIQSYLSGLTTLT